MKKIILILTLLFSVSAGAQVLDKPGIYGRQYRRLVVDTLFALPADTFSVPSPLRTHSFLARKGSNLYLWNTSSFVWSSTTGGGCVTVDSSATTTLTLSGTTGSIIFKSFSGASAATWTLPAVSSSANMAFCIKNRSAYNVVVQRTGSDKLFYDTEITSYTIQPGESFTFACDGRFWTIN